MIERLDHLVLTVADIETTCRFYADALGMEVVRFGDGRTALRFGMQKINLHQAGAELEPRAAHAIPGSADLCFVTRQSLRSVCARLRAASVTVAEGPVERTGALGPFLSLYCRDPDDNLVEISRYPDEGTVPG